MKYRNSHTLLSNKEIIYIEFFDKNKKYQINPKYFNQKQLINK